MYDISTIWCIYAHAESDLYADRVTLTLRRSANGNKQDSPLRLRSPVSLALDNCNKSVDRTYTVDPLLPLLDQIRRISPQCKCFIIFVILPPSMERSGIYAFSP